MSIKRTSTTKDMAEPLTVNRCEAARLLSISVRLLDDLTRKGEIPSRKIGGRRVYSVKALQAFVEGEAV